MSGWSFQRDAIRAFRFVRCGPYPGRWSVVAPFQSGIWLKSPLHPAAAPA